MSVKGKHLLHYVPHGINSEIFKPLDKSNEKLKVMKKNIFGGKDYEFVFFYNSRNIQRKRTSNIALAFKMFCENLPKEKAEKCILVCHTEKVLDAGTDLGAIQEAFLPNYNFLVLQDKFSPEDMNILYNIADVTINVSSNEGFGLSVAESIMSGTPVIVNVTGGLQDQIGQLDDEGKPVEFDFNFASNNEHKYSRHGIWAKPIWPVTRVIQGSPPTPYIFDDLCKWEDIAKAMMYWYMMPVENRKGCGLEGRRWAMNEGGLNHKNLSAQFIKSMDFTIENFVPEKSFSLHTANEHVGHKMPKNCLGFDMPKIDLNMIMNEIKEVENFK